MKDDGGPAFPIAGFPEHGLSCHCGMSLRDYFAAHESSWPSKEWLLGQYGDQKIVFAWDLPPHLQMEALARWRYQYADAMLAERAKGEK